MNDVIIVIMGTIPVILIAEHDSLDNITESIASFEKPSLD